jgi:hypothetical protein
MTDETITLDELLGQQEASSDQPPVVTIEALPDDDDRVKVTPYVPGVGCLCSRALNVPKASIARIEPTGDHHDCCGHRLLVVRVSFSDETWADALQQVSASIGESEHAAPMSRGGVSEEPIGWSGRELGQITMPGAGRFGRTLFEKNFPESTGSFGWDSARCYLQYAACVLSCGIGSSKVPWEYQDRCQCQCDNALARCFDPAAPQRPCP